MAKNISSNDKEMETSSENDIIYLSPTPETVTTSKKRKEEFHSSGKMKPSEMKRTSTDVTSKQAKKVLAQDEKKMGECKTRLYFQRRWEEKDEIALLQGILEFKDVTGKSMSEDRLGFFEFIKKSISFKVSVSQYLIKIKHLKRKYMKERKNGFLKAHDRKCVKLVKSIWGADEAKSEVKSIEDSNESMKQDSISSPNGNKANVFSNNGDVSNSGWFENSFLVKSVESLGLDSVKHKWSVVPIETKKKIEQKLELLQADELECKEMEEMLKLKKRECMKQKTDLLNEVMSLIIEAN